MGAIASRTMHRFAKHHNHFAWDWQNLAEQEMYKPRNRGMIEFRVYGTKRALELVSSARPQHDINALLNRYFWQVCLFVA